MASSKYDGPPSLPTSTAQPTHPEFEEFLSQNISKLPEMKRQNLIDLLIAKEGTEIPLFAKVRQALQGYKYETPDLKKEVLDSFDRASMLYMAQQARDKWYDERFNLYNNRADNEQHGQYNNHSNMIKYNEGVLKAMDAAIKEYKDPVITTLLNGLKEQYRGESNDNMRSVILQKFLFCISTADPKYYKVDNIIQTNIYHSFVSTAANHMSTDTDKDSIRKLFEARHKNLTCDFDCTRGLNPSQIKTTSTDGTGGTQAQKDSNANLIALKTGLEQYRAYLTNNYLSKVEEGINFVAEVKCKILDEMIQAIDLKDPNESEKKIIRLFEEKLEMLRTPTTSIPAEYRAEMSVVNKLCAWFNNLICSFKENNKLDVVARFKNETNKIRELNDPSGTEFKRQP